MTENVKTEEKQEVKVSDKELNFRALEAKFQKQLEEERKARLEAESIAKEALSKKTQEEEEELEPYVDYKRLEKKLTKFEQKLAEKIEKTAEEKARNLFENEKRNSWIQSNPDFFEVMQQAEKFAEKNPDLAETILKMPDGFERQRLVYANIKALNMHKPESKQPSIQEKIDANRRSPYYQPSGVATAPYSTVSDFSETGQKQAYEKMKELQKKMRA